MRFRNRADRINRKLIQIERAIVDRQVALDRLRKRREELRKEFKKVTTTVTAVA